MKLYAYRRSQARTLIDAIQDGSVRFIGHFDNQTLADLERVAAIKLTGQIVGEMCGDEDDIIFVEEE